MIFLLYGKEEYLVHKKQQEIWEAYLASGKTGFSSRRLQAGQLSPEELQAELETHSLFQEKKLVLLEGLFTQNALKEYVESRVALLATSKTLIVVLLERGIIPARDPLLQKLKKAGKVHEYKALSPSQLSKWIFQEGKNHGIEIGQEARALLIEQGSRDLWRISREIEKLSLFKKGRGSRVEKADIAALLPETILAGDIFAALDAVAVKNKPKAFNLLHLHLAKGEAPLYLLSMIHFQVRSLLEAKEQQTGWKARLAANISLQELKTMHELLLETDLAIKTGGLEPEAALDLFLMRVFSKEFSPDEIFFLPRYFF